MLHQIENIDREIEMIKKIQREIPELKSTIIESWRADGVSFLSLFTV